MNATLFALFGYVFWTLFLAFGVVSLRYHAQLMRGRPANSFAADGADLGTFGHRVTRAHGNSMEWLVIPVALLLSAVATQRTDITDTLAPLALSGRIAQSLTHLVSTSPLAVNLRGLFLGVQYVVWVIWTVQLFRALV